MTNCDFCEAEFFTQDRRVVALPRPSDKLEIVAVMWGCGKCEQSKELPTAAEIHDSVENDGHWMGEEFLFVSV